MRLVLVFARQLVVGEPTPRNLSERLGELIR